MPQPDQHTANKVSSQAQRSAEQCWQEWVQRLPAEVETQARSLGAFQRVRAVASVQALLRAVLSYVLNQSSLKHLSGWSRLSQISSKVLSAQAWHHRFLRCGPWLLWLLTALLDVRLETRNWPGRQRILLVDATHLPERGKHGENWRLHSAYDLLDGQLAWVQVSNHLQGECLAQRRTPGPGCGGNRPP